MKLTKVTPTVISDACAMANGSLFIHEGGDAMPVDVAYWYVLGDVLYGCDNYGREIWKGIK